MLAGYRRRRGWLAHQTAMLQRFDFHDGFPTLPQMMGLKPVEKEEQSPVAMLHNVRMWKAALAARG